MSARSVDVPGEQIYCYVLFAKNETDARPIEQDICRRLWRKRERVRQSPENVTDRVHRIAIRHPIVGEVVVWACLECRWVVWDAPRRRPASEHSGGCLERRKQKPDGNAKFLPKRVTRTAEELGAGGWGVYYDQIAPQRLAPASYWHVGRTNHAARQAQALWSRRDAFRAAEGRDLGDTHHVAVFTTYEGRVSFLSGATIDDYVSRALCLTCNWNRFGAHLYDEPDWRPRVLKLAREHEADTGVRQFGTWKELKRFKFGVAGIRVRLDDDGQPTIFMADDRSEAVVRHTLEYPVSEGDLWRSVSYLRPHLEERVESIDLPKASDSESAEVIDALARRFRIDSNRIVASLGNRWTSCDDLVTDHLRAGRNWFKIEPSGTIVGIGRRGSRVASWKFALGKWNPAPGKWLDVPTIDLLTANDPAVVDFIAAQSD